jgi:hypothetical protein
MLLARRLLAILRPLWGVQRVVNPTPCPPRLDVLCKELRFPPVSRKVVTHATRTPLQVALEHCAVEFRSASIIFDRAFVA